MMNGLRSIKQIHKIFKIKHNGWVYEKVCLNKLSNYQNC